MIGALAMSRYGNRVIVGPGKLFRRFERQRMGLLAVPTQNPNSRITSP